MTIGLLDLVTLDRLFTCMSVLVIDVHIINGQIINASVFVTIYFNTDQIINIHIGLT